jgi:hypothetical protein
MALLLLVDQLVLAGNPAVSASLLLKSAVPWVKLLAAPSVVE